MHFVCSLYASLSAYIFVPSALRTRLFSSLYALYAVFFGVVFPHRAHRCVFDAYNAYRLRAWLIALPQAKTLVYVIHHERVECKSPAEMRDVRSANRLTAATVRPYEIVCILFFSVRADEMRGYAT